MSVTLAQFVKAPSTDSAFTDACATEAQALVSNRIGDLEVPEDVRARAILEVGADLYHRRSTRNGVAGFADNDLNPFRVSRNPIDACEAILRPYMGGPFA